MDFDEIYNQLKDELEEVIRLTVRRYADKAREDGLRFLEESKGSLERWSRLLAEGQLSAADFEWLVMSQKDLLHLNGLKQAGLAKIRVDQFRETVLNLVIDVIFEKIL